VTTSAWFRGNPVSQGYCLRDVELRAPRFALRFATALCLPLVVVALLVLACASATTLNFCIPSEALARFEHRARRMRSVP
jgi:hypothetical protein